MRSARCIASGWSTSPDIMPPHRGSMRVVGHNYRQVVNWLERERPRSKTSASRTPGIDGRKRPYRNPGQLSQRPKGGCPSFLAGGKVAPLPFAEASAILCFMASPTKQARISHGATMSRDGHGAGEAREQELRL